MNKVNKPLIGVIGFHTYDKKENSIVAINNYCKNSIIGSGAIPYLICPLGNVDYYNTEIGNIPELTEEDKEVYRSIIDMCDGLLIPGGYRMYNYIDFCIRYAMEKDIPILGICFGLQALAIIDNDGYCLEANNSIINHYCVETVFAHEVEIVDNTLLSDIIKNKNISVNSFHNFHVTKLNKFIASAYSSDGLIEAIELPNKKFVLGVQWHPERMFDYDKSSKMIFERFINECKKI